MDGSVPTLLLFPILDSICKDFIFMFCLTDELDSLIWRQIGVFCNENYTD